MTTGEVARAWWNAHWTQQDGAAIASLTRFLESRERPLLEQVSALQAALVEIQANGWCPCVTIAGRALDIARARSQTEGA